MARIPNVNPDEIIASAWGNQVRDHTVEALSATSEMGLVDGHTGRVITVGGSLRIAQLQNWDTPATARHNGFYAAVSGAQPPQHWGNVHLLVSGSIVITTPPTPSDQGWISVRAPWGFDVNGGLISGDLYNGDHGAVWWSRELQYILSADAGGMTWAAYPGPDSPGGAARINFTAHLWHTVAV